MDLISFFLLLMLFESNIKRNEGTTWRTALLSDYYHCDINALINQAPSSMQNLSMDVRQSIIEYLQKNDIHSFMRTNKNNLQCCKQYMFKLTSIAFNYFLTHKSTTIEIKHLMDIPFVSSITINTTAMIFYFVNLKNGSKKSASSKYIGLDADTNNAFISFRVKKIEVDAHESKTITIVFNETNIHCIYFSDSSEMYSFQLRNDPCDSNNIKAINSLLLTGRVNILSNDNASWCLNELWEAHMFWPKIKNSIMVPHECGPVHCPNIYLTIVIVGLATVVIVMGILLLYRSGV